MGEHTPPVAAPVDAIVVMGVCGCGKTTVGQRIAQRLGWPFLEGDELHPQANVAKMSAGIALVDDDRWGWLDAIAARIAAGSADGRGLVVSCSALKRVYRDRLRGGARRVLFVHLQGDRDTILGRMAARTGHYMPASLVDSQFADLEPLQPDELAHPCGIGPAPGIIADAVVAALQRS